ncbi:MAG: insulinase family protein [Parcubacteria group bacterium]|nr:insulinase family protein [Parcubacteria group bacterium]
MNNDFLLHKYDNGLRLVVVPMKSTKTVTVLVLVGTGSRYETKELNGISHFLEHMMFKGTTKRPKWLQITKELDSIGAQYNAFTSKEYTGYWAKASSEHSDFILDVISDIFINSKLEEKEIQKERGVIVEEMNMYLDLPPRYVGDLYEELLYGDQPVGWKVIGEKETVSGLSRRDFVDYFNTHYLAENTIIAVAGNVDKEKIQRQVAGYFKNVRNGKKVTRQSAFESQDKPEVKLHYKKTDQTHFVLGVRAYDMFSPKSEAAEILGTVLGGGMSSRLFIEVREKQGLAYYVKAGADAYTDHGYLATQAGIDNKRIEKAIQIVLKEYKKMKDKPVPKAEIKKAKEYIKGHLAIELESSDSVATFFASEWLLKNETLTPEEKLSKIMAVTAEEVQAAAKEIFKPEKLNLALIGPFEDKEKFEKILEI